MENRPATSIYLVLEGVVKLTRYTFDGREVVFHFAEPYMLIAEAAIFLGHYPATAVATENSVLLKIRAEDIKSLIEKHPYFASRVFDTMSVWLKRLTNKINQLTLNDATARVCSYLLDLKDLSDELEKNQAKVHLPVKKGDLALMLNMKQGSLSRVFRRLQDASIITVSGRDILIHDFKQLRYLSLPELE